jgi:hypothetical protein
MAALDMLIPVEASVSGSIALQSETPLDGTRKMIKDRYDTAMNYLKKVEDGQSAITRYVEKQEKWAHALSAWELAQEKQRGSQSYF